MSEEVVPFRLINVERVIELSGGVLSRSAIREWPRVEGAPKPVKVGLAFNARRAFVEAEVIGYLRGLAANREQAVARASESARRAGIASAERRAARRRVQERAAAEAA